MNLSLDGNYFAEGVLGGDHEIRFGVDFYNADTTSQTLYPNHRALFIYDRNNPGGYKEIFAPASYVETGLDVRELVRAYFQTNSPVSAQLDGRITTGAPASAAAPATLPTSGGESLPWLPLTMALGILLFALGMWVRHRVAG